MQHSLAEAGETITPPEVCIEQLEVLLKPRLHFLHQKHKVVVLFEKKHFVQETAFEFEEYQPLTVYLFFIAILQIHTRYLI